MSPFLYFEANKIINIQPRKNVRRTLNHIKHTALTIDNENFDQNGATIDPSKQGITRLHMYENNRNKFEEIIY